MTTVIVADSDPSDNGADVVDNCSPPASGQCTVATQADVQPPIVCNGILCYLHNKMDIMVHDTLVKLCADHFTAIDTDTAKQHLYECEEVRKLGLRQGRRRQGPNRAKNNIEDILFALHKCPRGLPTFAVSDLSTLPQLDINDIAFGFILSEFRAMRAEMSELRSDVNDVKKKGVDKVHWPTIYSNATANDQHSRQVNRTPESNAAIGPTSGATSGATGCATSGATVGATIGPTSGATSGSTSGATVCATSVETSGATVGATSGATVGAPSGATSGETSGATVGATSGATSGATVGATSGATVGATIGATIGVTCGATSGTKRGATSGAERGARNGPTSGATRGDTRRSARANDDGFTTVTRRKSSFVNMKKPVIGTRSHGNTLKVSSGRFISIFASRLDPSVSCDALSAYINDVHSINANCEQLITKYNTYASFKVDVTCNDMSTFLHPDKWPQGVYLRKFFNNKK